MRRIFENGAIVFLIVVVTIGFGYSVYTGFFNTSAERERKQTAALVAACQNALGKSLIFQNFANKAAATRRASAARLSEQGDKVGAENDLAAAREYEKFAVQYDKLTVHNCSDFYNNS